MALLHELIRQSRRGLRLQGWNNGIDIARPLTTIGSGIHDPAERTPCSRIYRSPAFASACRIGSCCGFDVGGIGARGTPARRCS